MPKPKELPLTPWFPPEVKPVRVGVYAIQEPMWFGTHYAFWNGKRFCYRTYARTDAFSARHNYTALPKYATWRGVAIDPNAKERK